MKVSLLTGWTSIEYYSFKVFSLQHNIPKNKEVVVLIFGKERIDEFLKLYPTFDIKET